VFPVSGFTNHVAASAPKPAAVEVLKPEHFASDWQAIPEAAVAVGIKVLSEAEVQQVLAESAKEARLLYPDSPDDSPIIVKAYEDALVRLAVGRCVTNPNDARDPYFPAADEMVGVAWPSATIRRIWDVLERVTIACSPVAEPANDDDVRALCELLDKKLIGKMTAARELRTRKLVAFMLAELRAVESVTE
jgi:hypothetical protein